MTFWILLLIGCAEMAPERVASTYVHLIATRSDIHPSMHLLAPGCKGPHHVSYGEIDLITPRLLEETEFRAKVRVTVAHYPDIVNQPHHRAIGGLELDLVRVQGLWRVRCPAQRPGQFDVLKALRQH